ncbi:MAG TPA: transglutaminase domain-containing protein [Actinoplanes sp.]
METTFAAPGLMTGLGKHAEAVAGLPGDFAGIARAVQGLLIHEFWGDSYQVELTDADRETVHLRPADQILDAVLARDDRPLGVSREPGRRTATNCRGFTVVSVAMLRAHRVPARARCGFGTYFQPDWFGDHWVVEFHDGYRWRLGDAQIDDVQRQVLGIDFDLSDVGERFLVAGEAWRRVRAGEADPERFGLNPQDGHGEWWIAGNVMRDAAALTGLEVLPWDLWGAMPGRGEQVAPGLVDDLAAASREADVAAVERLLRDDRLGVPDKVFNVLRERWESLTPAT